MPDGTVVAFKYDPFGRRIEKAVNGQSTRYFYDSEDILFEYDGNGAVGNRYVHGPGIDEPLALINNKSVHYYHSDGLGNRIKRTVNGTETRYVAAPGSMTLAETDDLGNITAYYVYGLGLISKVTPAGDAYYFHYDAIGSTVAMTDSTGAVVNKYAYGIFGQIIAQDEQVENPFKYVGAFGVTDEGNGLYYMQARYYDPEVGRFISKDPIGLAGVGKSPLETDLYTYALNNPLNYIDPEGEHPVWIVITAGGVLVVYIFMDQIVPIIYNLKGHPGELHEAQPHLDLEVCHPVDPRTLRSERLPKQPPQRLKPQRPYRSPARR